MFFRGTVDPVTPVIGLWAFVCIKSDSDRSFVAQHLAKFKAQMPSARTAPEVVWGFRIRKSKKPTL